MLELRIRSFPRTTVVWFAEKVALPSRFGRLASYQLAFSQAKERPSEEIAKYATVSPFATLLINLTSSEDVLWQSLRKTIRQEVRAVAQDLSHELKWYRAENDSGVFDFLVRFCHEKNLPIPSRASYTRHIQQGMVSCCFVDGKINVSHFYLLDRECGRVRLLWSARALDDAARSHTARLNKLLHWEDLLYFKNELKMLTYDWGGIAVTDEALRGVDDFKRGFGGTLVTEWNAILRSPFYSQSYHRIAQTVLRSRMRH
jgi:hypothetical protein